MRRLVLPSAVLWALAVLAVCLTPGENVPAAFSLYDKAIHAAAFAGVGGLWALALRRGDGRAAFAAGLAFGALTEALQHVLPIHRSADPLDLLADAVGVALGVAVARVVRARFDPAGARSAARAVGHPA